LLKLELKFEKDNAAGKLSPNDVVGITKKLESKERASKK